MSKARRYVVTIGYREPIFEQYHGTGPQHFEGSFVVLAESESGASHQALAEFRRIEAFSGVGWARDIESVSVFLKVIEGGRR